MGVFKRLLCGLIGFAAILTSVFLSACSIHGRTLYQSDAFRISWLIEPGRYEDIRILSENYLALCKDEQARVYLIADSTGKILSKPLDACCLSEREQRILTVTRDNTYVFYATDGTLLSDAAYQDAFPFQEGYAAVCANGKWGFIDRNGHEVLPMAYDGVADGFSGGLAAVKRDGEWMYIRKDGTTAFACKFEAASMFSEGLAAVKENGKWGYVNTSGETVIECKFDAAHIFREGLAAVCTSSDEGNIWQYLSTDGAVKFTVPYVDASDGRTEMVGEFKNGYALISSPLYCLIDCEGKTVLGEDSAFLTVFSEYDTRFGVIPAYIPTEADGTPGKKYGYVDIHGAEVLPFRFDYASPVAGQIALVTEYDMASQSVKVGIITFIKT